MIRIECLSKTYNGRDNILNNLNLHVEKGEYVEIVGKSGAGKSTFLNIVGLLDNKYTGEVFIDGKKISVMTDTQISIIRNKYIGFIFQAYHLIPHLTVWENIMLPLIYSKKMLDSRFLSYVNTVIENLQISSLKNQKIQYLSGGEKQRVAIARALSLSPSIVLADEPTGNLDQTNGDIVFHTLSQLNKMGTTIILVTHNRYIDVGASKILTLSGGVFV